MLIAGLVILSIIGGKQVLETDWANLPTIVWVTVFYLAIIASSTTFFLLQYATLRLPSAKVMAYTYLVPAWVILWEAGMGNGMAGITVLAGIALTIIALLMLLKD